MLLISKSLLIKNNAPVSLVNKFQNNSPVSVVSLISPKINNSNFSYSKTTRNLLNVSDFLWLIKTFYNNSKLLEFSLLCANNVKTEKSSVYLNLYKNSKFVELSNLINQTCPSSTNSVWVAIWAVCCNVNSVTPNGSNIYGLTKCPLDFAERCYSCSSSVENFNVLPILKTIFQN